MRERKDQMTINTPNVLTNIKVGGELIWYVWEQISQYANSSYVDHYTDQDMTTRMRPTSIAFGMPFGIKANCRLVRGLKNGAILSFILDAPSIYRGIQENRILDVVKNEACNLGILGTASLIGGYAGFVAGSAVPGVGNVIGNIVGAGVAYGIAYGLEKLRHAYLPNSYLFHS